MTSDTWVVSAKANQSLTIGASVAGQAVAAGVYAILKTASAIQTKVNFAKIYNILTMDALVALGACASVRARIWRVTTCAVLTWGA